MPRRTPVPGCAEVASGRRPSRRHQSREPHMGRFRSRGEIQQRIEQYSSGCFGIQGLSPITRPGRFLARSTSHSVAARSDCTNIPLAAAGAQEDETILESGFLGHGSRRFVHLDPPGIIRSWKISGFGQRLSSGGFHHGSLDDDTGGHIFPERHQQLARQRHDGRLLKTAAIALDPFFEPQSQRRLRLMVQP